MIEQVLSGDVKVCRGRFFGDNRGRFNKLYDNSLPDLVNYRIMQVNFVSNPYKYTFRGLHFQSGEFAESKIFRIIRGSIQLVYMDTRSNGHLNNNSGGIILDDPGFYIVLPRGYATGYCTLEPDTEVLYFSDNIYSPDNECGIRYNEPFIKNLLPVNDLIISEKDLSWPDFNL